MPRFLWIGLLACVAVVVGVCTLLGRPEAPSQIDLGDGAHTRHPRVVDVTLETAHVDAARVPGVRPEAEPVVARTDGDPRVAGYRILDTGYGGDVAVSTISTIRGVVEVRVVREEDGTPLAGAEVSIFDETLRTDAGGIAVFPDVPDPRVGVTSSAPDRPSVVTSSGFGVTASAPGRPSVHATASFSAESPHASVEIRLFLERELIVRVLDPSGAPFRPEDWGIARTEAHRIGIVLTTSCGSLGRALDVGDAPSHSARNDGLSRWRLRIRGVAEGCVHVLLGDVVVGLSRVDAQASEVEVRIDLTAIDGTRTQLDLTVLDDSTGAPIEAANVEIEGAETDPRPLSTDARGRARASFRLTGTTGLIVRKSGFVLTRVSIERPLVGPVLVRMQPGRRITGVVVDEKGSPVPRARIDVTAEKLPKLEVPSVVATGDGRFALEGLPARELELRITCVLPASSRGSQRVTRMVDCREGDVMDLVVSVPIGATITTKR